MASDGARRPVLVAIDFGTTFSAVSWASVARPDIQSVIQEWPGPHGDLAQTTDEKVPTETLYQDYTCRWGYQIQSHEQRHLWFKLGLNDEDNDNSYLAVQYPDSNELPPSYDKSAKDLTTDYLRCLRDHLISVLQSKLSAAVVRSTPLRYTITVPAIWTEKARALTVACAVKAGMEDDIEVVSEPEAAAIHALDVLSNTGIITGDNIIVFDAGGGTVDIISLQVQSMKPGMPAEVVEIVPGDGHKCGASFLNRQFRQKLIDGYSTQDHWGADVLEEAEKYFEQNIKCVFSGKEPSSYTFKVPIFPLKDNASLRIERGRLVLTPNDVRAIFAPVVSSAVTLLISQIKKTKSVKKVIMVGGFSDSPHLYDRIKTVLPPGIELLKPAHARMAVVRGALKKALSLETLHLGSIRVVGRAARRHYGLSIGRPYDGNTDRPRADLKYWLAYYGKHYIGFIRWAIKKGDVLYESQPHKQRFSTKWLVSNGSIAERQVSIYSWEGDGIDGYLPPYFQKDAKVLATLKADLSSIPIATIPRSTGIDGKSYYDLDYEVQIRFSSAQIEYSL